MLRLFIAWGCLGLAACGGSTPMDAGQPPMDSGQPDAGPRDAGTHDAGVKDAGTPDAGFKGTSVDDWCKDQAIAQCDRELRCLASDVSHYGDCLARLSAGCTQLGYSRGVAEGRLQFLSPKADDCLNGYATGSCSATPDACALVFQGLVEPDGGCLIAEDCDVNAGICDLYDGQCPHRCNAYVGVGASCDGFTTQCTNDLWCGSNDGGFYYSCFPVIHEGQACTVYNSCEAGDICSNNLCTKQTAKVGEACGINGVYPYCDDDDFCRQDLNQTTPPPGTCERKAGVGDLCAGDYSTYYQICLPTLRCSTSFRTGTCEAKGGTGAPCTQFTDCENGMYCQPTTSTCQLLPQDGGSCDYPLGSDYECATGYYCDFYGVKPTYDCVAMNPVGGWCNSDQQCLSNDCLYGGLPDGGGVCIPDCIQRADGGF